MATCKSYTVLCFDVVLGCVGLCVKLPRGGCALKWACEGWEPLLTMQIAQTRNVQPSYLPSGTLIRSRSHCAIGIATLGNSVTHTSTRNRNSVRP